MHSRTRKIVVTGGAGFLGSHVVELLIEEGNRVVILDDFSNGKIEHLTNVSKHSHLEIVKGDITKFKDVQNAFKGCSIVIHLAILCLRQSIKEPYRVNEVIVNGTLNCLEAALENNVELFLNCSSSEVYGSANYIPMDENHPLLPETPYAAAKVSQDMYVRSYGSTYGLPRTTIRPFNMYGPNSHWQGHRGELIPKLIVRAMNRKPLIIFGQGNQSRDFTYVKDVAKALVRIMNRKDCIGECFNFCTKTETTVNKVAELICASFNLDPTKFIQRQPSRPGDVSRHCGDNSRFMNTMGFAPAVALPEGIRLTIDWYKSLPLKPEDIMSQEIPKNWE